MKKILTTIFLLYTLLIISCTKTTKLANRLEGMWNIDTRETINGAQRKSEPNIGAFEINKDGTGKMTINTVAGNFTNSATNTFYWTNTGTMVTLSWTGNVKYYRVLTNESKKQVWEESHTYTSSSTSGGTSNINTIAEKFTLSKK